MATNVQPATFDSISVGDELSPFTIGETQETIDNARVAAGEEESTVPNIHTDPEFARSGLFAGTVNSGVTTMAYIDRMLESWFPARALYDGGRMLFKAIEPVRPGDTVTFTGRITGKRTEGDRKIVDCEIKAVNQAGTLTGLAEATLVMER